ELAGDVGIGTAARQRDQAARVFRTQAVGAMPDPVLALGLVERVEVEHGLPLRLRLAVFLERGAAPEAALVLAVLPEVVIPVALLVDARDLVVGVVDGQQIGFQRLEAGGVGQLGLGLRVLPADPGELLFAFDVLEPLVRIGHFGVLLCGRAEGGNGKRGEQAGMGQLGHATGSGGWAGNASTGRGARPRAEGLAQPRRRATASASQAVTGSPASHSGTQPKLALSPRACGSESMATRARNISASTPRATQSGPAGAAAAGRAEWNRWRVRGVMMALQTVWSQACNRPISRTATQALTPPSPARWQPAAAPRTT